MLIISLLYMMLLYHIKVTNAMKNELQNAVNYLQTTKIAKNIFLN